MAQGEPIKENLFLYQPGGKDHAGKIASGRVGGCGLFLFHFEGERRGTAMHRAPSRLFWQQRRDILGNLVRSCTCAQNAVLSSGTGCGGADVDRARTASKPQPDEPLLPVASRGPFIRCVAFRRLRLLFSNGAPSILSALFSAYGRLQFLFVLLRPAGSFVGVLVLAEEEDHERSREV